MAKVYFLLFLLCVAIQPCHAQRVMTAEEYVSNFPNAHIYEGIYREGYPMMLSMNVCGPVKVDDSRIAVRYDADILMDSLSTNRIKDQVLTLIGPKYYHSFGLWFWRESISSAVYYCKDKIEKSYFESLLTEFGYRPKDCSEMVGWFVYRDLNARTVLNKHGLPLRNDTIEYSEPQPKMFWNISEVTKEILGYECQMAETDFRGRHWTVWFTPEIAVDCGFWKFSGLPGLILEAYSADDFYRYNAVSIENKVMKIMTYPKSKTKKLTREQFRKTESAVYANPIIGSVMFQKNGQDYMVGTHVSRDQKDTDQMVFTPNNYLGLYFPMELE